MMKGKGSSWSTFWACLLVALTHIVAISSQTQFCDDSIPDVINDISVILRNDTTPLPSWLSALPSQNKPPVVTEFTEFGEMVTGKLQLETHMGTHVVSPGHSLNCHSNYSVDKLNLRTLIGPVLVVDTPRDTNITAPVLQCLNLPVGLKRVIFRTSNTDRRLTSTPAYVTNYTGLTPDAATWLVENTAIEFVGIDYVSVGAYEDMATVYENLFAKPAIFTVEFLKLDEIKPGFYTVYCLPLRIEAEGSPARCILVE